MNDRAVAADRGRNRAKSRSRVERLSSLPSRDLSAGPLTILHLANHCDEVGNGIMNVAVDVACKQAGLGHRVAFASAGGSYVKLMQQHRVQHFRIDQLWRRPITLLRAFFALRRLLKLLNPDVVHAHMMTGAMLTYGLRLGGPFGYRLITTVHNEWQRSAILMGVGDRVIAVSDQVRDRMRRRGIPSRKLRVVKNATLGSPGAPPNRSGKMPYSNGLRL
jgi:Glycosyltransferase Family 4